MTNGNYRIKNGRGAIGIVPERSKEIFGDSYSDLENRAKVLIYIDEEGLDREGDSTRYLAGIMALDSYFKIALSTTPNPNLAEQADIVLVRFDPPIRKDFLDELEKYNNGRRLFINSPESQKYFGNKNYLEDIARENPGILPATIADSDSERLAEFMYLRIKEGDEKLIYKPANGFGGNGIERINLNEQNFEDLVSLCNRLTENKTKPAILQENIPGIYGDKRIHVINGEPYGAVMRVPDIGEFRCNVKQGGSLQKTELTEDDWRIVDSINPLLSKKEVYWAGIDVFYSGDEEFPQTYLGEINAVSPGCLVGVDLSRGNYGDNGIASEIAEQIKADIQNKCLMEAIAV